MVTTKMETKSSSFRNETWNAENDFYESNENNEFKEFKQIMLDYWIKFKFYFTRKEIYKWIKY